jgi:capsular exopolysaccharide synthesis family protein
MENNMPSDKISDAIKKAAKEKEEDFKKDTDIVTSIPKAPEKSPVLEVTKETPRAGVDPRIVAYHDPQSAVTEQYRTLWTHILSLDTTPNFKTMLITSSHPQEGKTVTALNLAVVMAHDSKKEILLLDCNLRSPVIHNFLARKNVVAQFIEPMKGLSDIFKNDLPLDTVLFKTNIPNLTVLPGGEITPNPTEILGSQKMRHLLTELKEQFGYVVLDSPPVIPYADSRVLSPLVDGAILVVQTEKTRREVVWEAESVLTGVGTKILGYILTGVEYHIPEYIYSHL